MRTLVRIIIHGDPRTTYWQDVCPQRGSNPEYPPEDYPHDHNCVICGAPVDACCGSVWITHPANGERSEELWACAGEARYKFPATPEGETITRACEYARDLPKDSTWQVKLPPKPHKPALEKR